MAEIQLNQQEQQQLANLLDQLAQDPALRARLNSDPRSVFGEFGLNSLAPQVAGLQVTVVEPDVAGYARSTAHVDSHFDDHTDHTQAHPGGFGINITPSMLPEQRAP
jgi:hypothetical protein